MFSISYGVCHENVCGIRWQIRKRRFFFPSFRQHLIDRSDHRLRALRQCLHVLVSRQLITDARRHATSAVNIALTLLYWRVGDRIRRDVLQNERGRYGEQILATLSQEIDR